MYEVFEQLLQKYGVTSYKVSKETGVTQTSLSNWKSGRNTPSAKTLQKIADYFGVTVDYLMTGKEELKENSTELTAKDEKDIAMVKMVLPVLKGLIFPKQIRNYLLVN